LRSGAYRLGLGPAMVMRVLLLLSMMAFARAIGDYVARHPTVKMLALAFLLAIGVMLMADGFGHHVPKGYLYFAMAFSLESDAPAAAASANASPPAGRGGRCLTRWWAS
jgi:predicted tellurium resistance membrane protein TerC